MNRLGHKKSSIRWRCSSRSWAQAFQDSPGGSARRSPSDVPPGGPDLHLPELGVRHEHAVDEDAGADAGAEGQEDDDAALARALAEAHLGDARRVRVVDDLTLRLRILPSRSAIG